MADRPGKFQIKIAVGGVKITISDQNIYRAIKAKCPLVPDGKVLAIVDSVRQLIELQKQLEAAGI